MNANRLTPSALGLGALVVATAVTSACGLDKQTAPSLIGPSGYALSLRMSASPDILRRDGVSRSTITVNAFGADGAPVGGRRFLLSVAGGAGALTVEEIVTDSNGRASSEFIAPEADVDAGSATISASPFGEDFGSTPGHSVRIGLVGPAFPSPSFTFSPASAAPATPVRFDASATTVDGAVCGSGCIYRWEFNDEATLEGQIVEYSFQNDGFYNVALTVYSLKHNTQKKIVQRLQIGLP